MGYFFCFCEHLSWYSSGSAGLGLFRLPTLRIDQFILSIHQHSRDPWHTRWIREYSLSTRIHAIYSLITRILAIYANTRYLHEYSLFTRILAIYTLSTRILAEYSLSTRILAEYSLSTRIGDIWTGLGKVLWPSQHSQPWASRACFIYLWAQPWALKALRVKYFRIILNLLRR